jgi:superfamily II RNA helicase
MVKICSYTYNNSDSYDHYYSQFNFPLHDFQKWAIEAIVTGNHVLITAPTGTGKTLPAEFAINYFHSIGKKIIYTCPIKALSNEKFYDFTKKFPHINIGIVTGDISCNPNADVIIMTLEILMNKLYNKNNNLITSFEMNIQEELGCVVFDEIHFINDDKRGTNWEQTIMMLPRHIQMIGLSATLDHPEKFAEWLENRSSVENSVEPLKEVYLCRKLIRSVPLIHYSFITSTSAVNKKIKDKSLQQEIQQIVNKPLIIQNEKNIFNEDNYQKIYKTLNLFNKYDIQIKRRPTLNAVSEYLVEHEMLPALCYIFSRKQLEICAEEVTTNLLEFDSKVPYIVDYECEQILRKLPNYQEYLQLPEYINTIKLFRKGIGMHHAGLIPILREMTELLFSKGYIKLLFCTETMSIGINLPVKTTIFTDINKFNGDIVRTLYSHEYTQAAGRAGRLGLDSVGHVIHLTGLFRNVDSVSLKNMMKGTPQKLISKFHISYNLLLNLIDSKQNYYDFAKQSMGNIDIQNQIICHKQELEELKLVDLLPYRHPVEIIKEYIDLKEKISISINKKRKEYERKLISIENNYNNIDRDVNSFNMNNRIQTRILETENIIDNFENFTNKQINNMISYLENNILIEKEKEEEYKLTLKGKISANIREINCIVFSNILLNSSNYFHKLSSVELITLFSCFTGVNVPDDKKTITPNFESNIELNNYIMEIDELCKKQSELDSLMLINGETDELTFDLIEYIIYWCNASNEIECKDILQRMSFEKNIFSGEFIKCILKINNIANELKVSAELLGNIELLSKLNNISQITLKYIATNQSLYV